MQKSTLDLNNLELHTLDDRQLMEQGEIHFDILETVLNGEEKKILYALMEIEKELQSRENR